MNLVPLIAGILFLGIGLFVIYDYYRFNKGVIKSQGKVVHYDEYQSKDNDNRKTTKYRPTFEFVAGDVSYRIKSKTSFHSQVIPVGHETEILYHQGDENNARLAKGNSYWIGILFVGLSAPAIYIGAFQS